VEFRAGVGVLARRDFRDEFVGNLDVFHDDADVFGVILVRFAPELVDLLRYETSCEHHDQWGDASVRRPIYERLTFSASLALEDGKFGFVGLLSPKNPAGGRDTTRKIMLFVRADVITIEDPDTLKP
jgi:hypothetical protein